jgi:hypothetical protein
LGWLFGSYDQRAQKITRAFAAILNHIGISMRFWEKKNYAPAILSGVPAMNLFSR